MTIAKAFPGNQHIARCTGVKKLRVKVLHQAGRDLLQICQANVGNADDIIDIKAVREHPCCFFLQDHASASFQKSLGSQISPCTAAAATAAALAR